MPNSPTGYTSFSDYMGLAGDEVKRLQERAFEDSDQQGQYAQTQLDLAGRQARATGQGDITKTASYGNYVQAAREASRRRQAAKANYDANAGTNFEQATNKQFNRNAYENDFRQKGYAAGRTAKQYATAQEQQRARDAAYNKKYADSMAEENAAAAKAKELSDREARRMAGYNAYSDAVNADAEKNGGIGQSAANEFDWSKYE